MEVEADLLDGSVVKNHLKASAYSWEASEISSKDQAQICASECAYFPFAPELCTENLLPIQDRITARIVKNESDLVMDFAYLLCGWESRSIQLKSDRFLLRYKLSLPGVSYTIIERICHTLNETAMNVLMLEKGCSDLSRYGSIQLAFNRAVMETVRLHRSLVLKLGTVKSLPLFVKLTRRCCDGIKFISRIYRGIQLVRDDVHMLLTLLSFSPYAHGEFEKKLLAFLLKSCTKPYVNFITNITRGVIVENQVEDFCGAELLVHRNVNAATGGIGEILINLHLSVVQCIRNGKILHSDYMKEAIAENIRRAKIANEIQRKLPPLKGPPEIKGKEPEIQRRYREIDVSQLGTLTDRTLELKSEDKTKLSASLGIELEEFYKELQGRLKTQYDLEDWKQRRAKMALKRRGLQVNCFKSLYMSCSISFFVY